MLLRVQQQFAGDGASGALRFYLLSVGPLSYVCCFQAARHGYTASGPIHFCQQHRQVMCRASARAVHAFIYTPGGALRSRKSSFFRGAGPNLTRLIVAAGKETHTAAYQPPRRHSSRGVPSDPAEAARAAGGCLVRSRPVRRRRRGTIQRGLERGCKIKNNYPPPYRYATRRAVEL